MQLAPDFRVDLASSDYCQGSPFKLRRRILGVSIPTLLIAAWLIWGASAPAQVDFDVYRDFCILQDPWLCAGVACCTDHGYAASPDGLFTRMPLRGVTNSTTAGRIVEWLGVSRTADPTFYRNTNSTPLGLPTGRWFQPRTVMVYPGVGGQPDAYAVLLHWVEYLMTWPPGAPGLIEMRFDRVGSGDVDVHVLLNSAALLTTNLALGGVGWTNLASLSQWGDLLRIAVGPGADGVSGAGVRVSARLSLAAPPRAYASVSPSTVRYGGNATFSVYADGTGPFWYQWRRGDTPILGATNQTYILSDAQVSSAGGYSVVVSNRFGAEYSGPVMLRVDASPLITQQPGSLVALAGETAAFDSEVAGLAPFAFQWRRDGIELLGATTPLLSFMVSGLSDAGLYTVVITNTYGAVTSAPARLYAATNYLTACDALSLSNAVVQGGYYRFTCDGILVLPQMAVLFKPLRLDGNGHSVKLSGGGANKLFYVQPGAPLTLLGLTLADGVSGSAGGAIWCMGGSVMARECRFENNLAGTYGGSTWGGAIYNNAGGQITLMDCVFTNNVVTNGSGGAISLSNGQLLMTNCVFLHNVALQGGAMDFYEGIAFISDCVLADNQAVAGAGGGIKNYRARLYVTRSRFFGNSAPFGGGVYNGPYGYLLVADSHFEENVATMGGGICHENGGEIFGTTFLRNRALGATGATGGEGNGGAIWTDANLILSRCLLANNSAEGGTGTNGVGGKGQGGAVYCQGYYNTVENSTFLGNTASGGSGASPSMTGFGYGGAIFTRGQPPQSPPLSVFHCTFASNGAFAASAPLDGGTLHVAGSALRLQGSILADSAGGVHSTGAVINLGFNLSSDATPAFLNQSNSLNNIDAMLSPLADNGGPTLTMALLPGSPALDAIPPGATTRPIDQRGVPRPTGVGTDIGAFELGPASTPRLSIVRSETAVSIQFNGEAGHVYRLLRSSDLRTWTSTDSKLVTANGWRDFTVATGDGSPGFYRICTP